MSRIKNMKKKVKDNAFYTLIAAPIALAALGWSSSQYMDLPGFSEKVSSGRTKNALATLVAAEIGRGINDRSSIDMAVEKTYWSDTRVTGYTTESSADTKVKVLLTSANYTAKENGNGLLEGRVKKSEFDWRIKEKPDGTLDVSRFGPKWNTDLEMEVKDGKISGKYVRSGPHFDWKITGTYDNAGNVNCKVNVPFGGDITLNGKVTSN